MRESGIQSEGLLTKNPESGTVRPVFKYYILLLTFYIFSCEENKFPDFTKTPNGLWYKLDDVGDNDKRAKPGDYITAQIIVKSEKDSILYDTRSIFPDGAITFMLNSAKDVKDYREGFFYLSEGDSATFITDAYAFYMKNNHVPVPKGMKMESIIKVGARVIKIRTSEEHEKDMLSEKARPEKGEITEKKILEKYLAETAIPALLITDGIYYIKLREGSGSAPDSGKIALLNYKGSFLNGKSFDFYYQSHTFEYLVGQEKLLIKGLEIGVLKMREGEKSKFIIPSHLAFGSSGSSTGIIPPFTTVIYEVELLKVQ